MAEREEGQREGEGSEGTRGSGGATARLFVALRFPEATRHAVWRAAAPLRETGAKVRWTPERQLHLTLKFLGDVPGARIPAIEAALAVPGAASRPFGLAFEGVGAFPSLARPRVLWVGADGGPDLPALHERVEDALGALGFEPETRPFHPHVTLGRVRTRGRAPDALADAAGRVTVHERCEIEALHLMRSRLGAGGARHDVEATVPFVTADGPGS